ncbi:MAG: hypothetical protein GWN84_08465 [Gammaproteobacteria bacterium]|nr:hypothetical protein [Gammaproteobacteria bacterium]NIR82901.1 hypothetical protein [Gammaproteobacteria bacterium]NIR90169.1 hypothetical protein [Gammaproteobacteria bacterium]NIU03728.1 hypothetical protein [Gammaproteobacteria bacterium]NIV51371.1 hypothetical protein [Gammaproteobacteria bacterium]
MEGWNDCVAFPEGSVDWPVLLASANEANAKLYRPSSLECINALAELVALTHAAGVARPTTEQERRRAKLEMMLENALWNVDLSRRVLARWHGYDTVVRAVQRELQRRPGGPELADAIELARDRIGGQP